MFTKGDKIYAEAYKYLRSLSGQVIAFSIAGKIEDYEEVDMALPLTPMIENGMIFFEERKIAIAPKSLSYSSIKEHIIKGRYTNDEQIAIILNQSKSEEDATLFAKMQEWRDFAADVARVTMLALHSNDETEGRFK